ncbi:MAG: hypothetical protein WBX19_17645, partial [Terracidiphilus sp.]
AFASLWMTVARVGSREPFGTAALIGLFNPGFHPGPFSSCSLLEEMCPFSRAGQLPFDRDKSITY